MITLKEENPSTAQWMALRKSVGWADFPAEVAEKSLSNTLFCVTAYEGENLVAMGRVLGDGVFTFYIGNIMVTPEKQNMGIGKMIMERVLAYVDKNACKGAIASLLSIKGKEDFYSSFGFAERPDDTRGAGMSKYY